MIEWTKALWNFDAKQTISNLDSYLLRKQKNFYSRKNLQTTFLICNLDHNYGLETEMHFP